MIEILSTGMLNSVQDLGRTGYLSIGVGQSGAMDTAALTIGNLLLGNPPTAAGLEIVQFPFRVQFHSDCRFAITGADSEARIADTKLPPNWSCVGIAGQTLVINAPIKGVRAYLALSGGIDVPNLMGSKATDLKSGFGGFHGQGLRRGDRLNLHDKVVNRSGGIGVLLHRALPSPGENIQIRVLRGAEFNYFRKEAVEDFFTRGWIVTQDANRMGMRLYGPELKTTQSLNLLSHGILPGAVQVPPSGQPIIQMAEANTCGGYPKIAYVIDADLWLLAQAPIGSSLKFVEVDHKEAMLIELDAAKELEKLRLGILSAF